MINYIHSASENFFRCVTTVDKDTTSFEMQNILSQLLSVKLFTIFMKLWYISIFYSINFIIQYIYLTNYHFPIFNLIFKFRAQIA